MMSRWAASYLQDAMLRLGHDFGGATLNSTLLMGMQQMCSYDTVAFGASDFARSLRARSGSTTNTPGTSNL